MADSSSAVDASPAMGEHLRPTEADAVTDSDGDSVDATDVDGDSVDATDVDGDSVTPGVYRVVGTGDPVALLRVGDERGRRVNAGVVVRVARTDLSAFEAAENPDGNRPPGELVTGALSNVGWQLRTFAGGLRANPLLAGVALAVFLAGQFGEGSLPGPDSVPAILIVLGAFGLAYAGSRGPV